MSDRFQPPEKVATYSPRDNEFVDPLDDMPERRDSPAPTRSPARKSSSQRSQRMHDDRRAQEERASASAQGLVSHQGEPRELISTSGQDIARRELERRWKVALEEEERLRQSAMNIERMEKQLAMVSGRETPNFPPSFCCIRSVIHHDINGDIALERQGFVRAAWYNYLLTVVFLIANAVVTILCAIMPDTSSASEVSESTRSSYSIHFVFSVVYLLGIVFAFIVWYWPLYKSCATGNSLSYVLAFLGLGVACGFCVLVSSGAVGYGGAGFLFAYYTRQLKGNAMFIVTIVMAALWTAQTLAFVGLIFFLRRWYLEDKASLASAKTQFTRTAAKTAVTLA